jgi:hypothetical protein
MDDIGTLSKLSESDRLYTVRRLNRQARNIRLEAARAAAVLSTQLIELATTIEAEAAQLEHVAVS